MVQAREDHHSKAAGLRAGRSPLGEKPENLKTVLTQARKCSRRTPSPHILPSEFDLPSKKSAGSQPNLITVFSISADEGIRRESHHPTLPLTIHDDEKTINQIEGKLHDSSYLNKIIISNTKCFDSGIIAVEVEFMELDLSKD